MTLPLPPPVAHCSVFSSADEDRILVLVVRRGRAGGGRGWVATTEQCLSLGRDQFSRVGHTGRFEWVFHLTFFHFRLSAIWPLSHWLFAVLTFCFWLFPFDFLSFDLYPFDFLQFWLFPFDFFLLRLSAIWPLSFWLFAVLTFFFWPFAFLTFGVLIFCHLTFCLLTFSWFDFYPLDFYPFDFLSFDLLSLDFLSFDFSFFDFLSWNHPWPAPATDLGIPLTCPSVWPRYTHWPDPGDRFVAGDIGQGGLQTEVPVRAGDVIAHARTEFTLAPVVPSL